MGKVRQGFSKAFKKPHRKWTILVLLVLVVGFFGFRRWQAYKSRLPDGIASGNGRIESTSVDVSSKEPLKVKEVLVKEGDLVKPGQVVVQMDTSTLEAQLAEAMQKKAAATEQLAVARAGMSRRGSEIQLARIETERSKKLVAERAGSQREADVRAMTLQTTQAGYAEEKAKLEVAQEEVKVADATVATIQTRIDDATLKSPVFGRVLYRLAEPGEVLAPGGKALTLVDLQDVYMEIFLPSRQAAALKVGSEARFTVDYAPDKVGVGFVSFVSPEAQFSPKEVETRSEREKLMFRVKIQVPKELIGQFIERVKTGVRGVGYVKYDPDAEWPDWLDRHVVRAASPQQEPGKPVSSKDESTQPAVKSE